MKRSAVPALGVLAVLLALAAVPAAGQQGTDIFYDGTFVLKPNGDMAVTMAMTLPMVHYDRLRNNISNLYLLLRGLASARADTEVVDKKADWDDANRKITFSMTVLGAVRNMGTHWEIPVVPGAIFTTFNEKERTFYFSEAGSGPMGTIRGNTKGVLPEAARNPKWDESRRVVTYEMPAPRAVSSGPVLALLIPGLSAAGVGIVLIVVSLLVGPRTGAQWRGAVPGGPPPQPPQTAPPLPQQK